MSVMKRLTAWLSQILVSPHQVLIARRRIREEIVLAQANRESPKSAVLPFPQGSHSLGVLSLPSEDCIRKTVRKP